MFVGQRGGVKVSFTLCKISDGMNFNCQRSTLLLTLSVRRRRLRICPFAPPKHVLILPTFPARKQYRFHPLLISVQGFL